MHPTVYTSLFLAFVIIIAPSLVRAVPFGGSVRNLCYCYNTGKYVELAGPRGGAFIWTGASRTYQNGSPMGSGQWMLGQYGHPYFCIYSIQPLRIVSGAHILMQGASVAPAGSMRPTGLGGNNCLAMPGVGFTGSGNALDNGLSVEFVGISEVFASVDDAHGSDPNHEWIELYNGTRADVDASGWTLLNAAGSSATLPASTTIPAQGFLLVSYSSTVRDEWEVPEHTVFAVLNRPLAGGLGASDGLLVRTGDGTPVDAVSWGTNGTVFSPAAPAIDPPGRSLARRTRSVDTNTAADWTIQSTPTPGW